MQAVLEVKQSKHLSCLDNLLLPELGFFAIWDQASEKVDAMEIIPK